MEEMGNVYNILLRKLEGRDHLGPKNRSMDNIKVFLRNKL
jgi:hypothetical protein